MTAPESSSNRAMQDLTALLVQRLRQGESDAGQLLDRTHRDSIYRFCLGYLGNHADAQDAVQETFCMVLKTATIPDHFRVWLYKIARNHCLRVIRMRGRKPSGGALPADSFLPAETTGLLTRLVHAEDQARLQDILAALSPAHLEVLRLRYGENLSRDEIAEVLEIPESLVKSRLYEAVKKLRHNVVSLGGST